MAHGQVRRSSRRIEPAGCRDHRRRKNPMPIVAALQSLGFSPGLKPLAQRLPPSQRPALAKAIAEDWCSRRRLSIAWKPGPRRSCCWATSSRQWASRAAKAWKRCFAPTFANDNKPIGELETNEEQLGFFDRLPESAQVALLEGAIEDTPAFQSEFGGMLDAWSRGDVTGIARDLRP